MGVAIDALKCKGCNQVYCRTCLPKDVFDKSVQICYPNKAYECYKGCGQKEVEDLSKLEQRILKNMNFACQHHESHGC